MEDFTNLAPDKSRARKFLYHKDKQPMIVYIEDANKYYAEGWEDTPAAFFNMKAHGVDEDKIPELHKEMDDIKEMVNDELNLDAMDAPELKSYAKKYLPGLKFFANAKKPTMLKLIREAKAEIEKEETEFIEGDYDNTAKDN